MSIPRRTFIRQSAAIAAGLAANPALARQDGTVEKAKGTVLEKKLDKTWVQNLYNRTQPTTYLKSRNELSFIGMPAGGIGCGMVYLGGDGRLWLWDVFNKNQTGVVYKNVAWHEPVQFNFKFLRPFDGANYVEPVRDVRPLEHGFIVRIRQGDKIIIKRLQESDWEEIAFEATYPMARISYRDPSLPVNIDLRAGSPFIPLNEDDSGLPATLFNFTITNKFSEPVQVEIAALLENKASIYSADSEEYFRVNEGMVNDQCSSVFMKSESYNWADEAFGSAPDYGNFCLSSPDKDCRVNVLAKPADHAAIFDQHNIAKTKISIRDEAIGSITRSMEIGAGSTATARFTVSWYFPNLSFDNMKNEKGRFYSAKFKSAAEVAAYIEKNRSRLVGESEAWMNVWYNETTLPHWFMERTLLNVSTLATTTVHRFSSGRFYAWEGVGSCPGTCTHVWQYAQAVGRLFPALERDTRERVDLGVGFHSDGHIGFRAEYDTQPAIDGQAGRILGIYREHQMSNDDTFLRRVWPRTRIAVEYLMRQDINHDGMTDTQLENTLDAKWPGEIAWIVGLSITAVTAAQRMAEEMNDTDFATRCKNYVTSGISNLEKQLYNGEYFIHKPDAAKGRSVIGSYNTCHIDQVYGQSWAHQVGLGRVISKDKTRSALKALWQYNFTTDVGPYLKTHTNGRPYALPGEGGMIMNTNPYQENDPYGVRDAWQVTYFHECMSGFEHQVASHMMAEGMTEEALILTRTIHDRYHAAKRNPFNEVECSDHYARAMASYGTFITACGFTYHGPKGLMGFAPKLTPDDFKVPFVTAGGWGTYAQKSGSGNQSHLITLKYGALKLNELELEKKTSVSAVRVKVNDHEVPCRHEKQGSKITVRFDETLSLLAGQTLSVVI